MSDKAMATLAEPDRHLRLAAPVGMESGIKQLIVRQCGFELYNTRPYHNYETWSDGYIVLGRRNGGAMGMDEATALLRSRSAAGENYLTVSREDLDDAVRLFSLALAPNLHDLDARFKKRR